MAVEHRHGVGLGDDLGALVGQDGAAFDLAHILRHADHAMGIMAVQIGVDEARGDLARLLGGRPRRRQDLRADLAQHLCRNLHPLPPVLSLCLPGVYYGGAAMASPRGRSGGYLVAWRQTPSQSSPGGSAASWSSRSRNTRAGGSPSGSCAKASKPARAAAQSRAR